MKMQRKKTAIVGLGLIGGSLAIKLHEHKIASGLTGVDLNPAHAAEALELDLVDQVMELDDAIAWADIIILAVPVDKLVSLLPYVLDRINNQVVVDLGSTKGELVASVANHPKRGRYVPSHPMWGTEYSGPSAAVRNAFENKAAIICNPDDSDDDALEWVKSMYKKIGMHLLEMDAAAHDLHAAYVSHISHITSFALANTVLEKEKEVNAIFELASAGFESTVRLAKSNPSMWVPIFLQNREHVLDVLKEHIAQLEKFRINIEEGNEAALSKLIHDANSIRKIIQ